MRVVTTAAEATLPDDIVIPGWAAHPDRVPFSPSANDEEFDAALSGAWTTHNGGTIAVLDADSTFPSHLYIEAVAGTTSDLQLVTKPAPAMPFTMTAKVAFALNNLEASNQFGAMGISIAESSPGEVMNLMTPSNQLLQNYNVEVSHWLTPTSYDTSPFFNPASSGYSGHAPAYLRMVVASSSDVSYYFSFDGLLWIARALNHDPGFTIGRVGLMLNRSVNNALTAAAFDWIRFT